MPSERRVVARIAAAALSLAALCAAGCDGDGDELCALDAGVVPGCGVAAGDVELRLGDPRATAEAALGALTVRDLGPAGLAFRAADAALGGYLASDVDGQPVVAIDVGAEAGALTTAGGVGVGADEAAVEAEFGTPRVDPFLGAWRYPQQGLAFTWAGDGTVARIQLFEPAG